ncbi:fungal-specific transcription factor domain-containing protein [Russula earlei]|uniref:Fungal-specific transcription factor domain-containing protein n=1 Tax=Russula earlei TaxID=71964 RepID=A0ACC0UFC1_9AGAM|nr:fungal-specific transcription factor domain-containing protein [Russula earlei]
MEPGYGTDPEQDTQSAQPPPTSRSADKPRKRPKSTGTVPSPDLRKFPPSPIHPSYSHLLHISASRPSLISHAREEPQRSASKRPPPESRPVLVHSFPAAQFPVMNPSYPSNGTPFPQPHPAYHHHPSTPGHSSNGVTASHMAGQNHPSPYAYPVHHSPYTSHHPFPHYSPYPQQIMMYAPSRPTAAHEAVSQPSPTATPSQVPLVQLSSGKRKRRTTDESQGENVEGPEETTGASGSAPNIMASGPRANVQHPLPPDIKKRTKTQRACDSCRSRKIRSVALSSLAVICSGHAISYSHGYATILPDSEPPLCQHCKQYGFDCTFFLPIAETRFKKKKQEEEAAAASAEKSRLENADRPNSSTPGESSRPADARVYGPTSEAHLLHSSATIPSRLYENYDARHHHKWEVSQSGDGLIQVVEPSGGDAPPTLQKPIDMRIERDVVEKLVNAYFAEIAPILPIITQAEFLSNSSPSPPPILLYSICLVAAARREVPQSVFDAIRYAVNSVIKGEDVLSTASIVNVQSLLILCMVGDCHSQFVPNALSALWIRLGTAIRMAQDLGLHRAEAVKQNIEMRRRLWGACLISDRWVSLSYGHPYMIDVNDCDARLPSSGSPHGLYVDELARLSIILGRVLKTIYSPAGLMNTNDEALATLLADIENWKKNLPPSLQFRGADTPTNAGVLFLLYCCVLMIFWRVFMRISYSCPEHLKFALTIESWSNLVELTGDAIDWLDLNDKLYDVWMLVAYAATSCALVQYHTWARRQDQDAAMKLKRVRDCIRRWEKSLSPDHMSVRRKTAEIIALLYEATQGPPPQMERPALNPTSNVTTNKPPSVGGRPGGGVFVAHGTAKGAYPEVAPGVIIEDHSEEEDEGEVMSLLSKDGLTRGADDAAPAGARGDEDGGARSQVALGQEGKTNVNPMLNEECENVQVVNVLDSGLASTRALEQLALADNNWLDGIPGGMFDWGQWDEFFTRIGSTQGPAGSVLAAAHGPQAGVERIDSGEHDGE